MRAVDGEVVQRAGAAHLARFNIDVCDKAAAAAVVNRARPVRADALHGKAQLKFLRLGAAQDDHAQGVCAVGVNFVKICGLVRVGADEPFLIAAQTLGELTFRVRLVVADDAVAVIFYDVHALTLARTHGLYDKRPRFAQKRHEIIIIVYDVPVHTGKALILLDAVDLRRFAVALYYLRENDLVIEHFAVRVVYAA